MPPDVALPTAPAPYVEPPVARRDPEPSREAPSEPPRCANCGAPAGEAFCARCGQSQHDYHRSMRSIAGEALDALAGWDAKIPASIGLLLARPGRLTTEFLRGRRARYLRPLRLYLMLSVAFFVTLRYEAARGKSNIRFTESSIADTSRALTRPARDSLSALAAAAEGFREGVGARQRGGSAIDSTELGDFLKHRPADARDGPWRRLKLHFKDRLAAIARLPAEQRDSVVRDAFLGKLGNLAICLVPLFALLLRVLWFRARLYYAEHFVVALHTHAFAFGALTLIMLLAEGKRGVARLPIAWLASSLGAALTALVVALAVWLPVYPFLAFRHVYGGSRAATLAKYVVLGGLYSVALLTGLVLTVLAAILVG